MEVPNISVIVPVYNKEKYLHLCIDSILMQTFKRFELLIVDDGSTDSSGDICDDYASKDSRIRVFHKQRGGVSSARNLGIDNAGSQYVFFVNSDDYVSNCYLQNLFNENSQDLVLSNFRYENKNLCHHECELGKCSLNTRKEIIEHVKSYPRFYEFVCCKLFKTEILRKYRIRFDENLRAGEDITFIYDYLRYVKNISILPMKDYIYDVSVPDSLSKQCSLYCNEYFFHAVYSSIWNLAPDGMLRDVYVKGRAPYFQHKIKDIFTRNRKIRCVANELKDFLSKEFILPFIYDRKVMLKGYRGRLFDYLAQKKQ
ncbi:glycosyltransferase family 2 protein [Phocaeicola vulgatus]|uniref:glycosyltransferase family 2 protein n=1 Tax=Phocaeicola vulgatus TaxID=821 RepID=UPI0008ACDE03|nr:glycosyltransferase family 2 protein [Phocaeicola vulgatus]SEL01234.1 Glycosyltransferase involved in cell wall bisynthesis [Phocaeicola vulgatus]